MRLISLDLILGAPRLQQRIEIELAQLTHDVATVRQCSQQLRQGIAHKVTSLPGLAIAVGSGFVVGKLSRAKHWRGAGNATNTASTTSTLWWQLLMPLVISWLQTAVAPADREQ